MTANDDEPGIARTSPAGTEAQPSSELEREVSTRGISAFAPARWAIDAPIASIGRLDIPP
jgi:hypothetical protein